MSKPYHRPWSNTWFTKRRGYVMFMLREATALFMGIYLIFLLAFLCKLGAGEQQFVEFLAALTSPAWVLFHVIMLIGAAWHAITWFNLTPKAMPLRIGEDRVPDPLVAFGMGYLPWIIVTIIILMAVCP